MSVNLTVFAHRQLFNLKPQVKSTKRIRALIEEISKEGFTVDDDCKIYYSSGHNSTICEVFITPRHQRDPDTFTIRIENKLLDNPKWKFPEYWHLGIYQGSFLVGDGFSIASSTLEEGMIHLISKLESVI